MVKIRLRRMGAKKAPYYRIIVADSRSPRDGRCIEEIGTYDPKAESAITVDAEKAKQWMKNGAQPTDTVRGLLIKANVRARPPCSSCASRPRIWASSSAVRAVSPRKSEPLSSPLPSAMARRYR